MNIRLRVGGGYRYRHKKGDPLEVNRVLLETIICSHLLKMVPYLYHVTNSDRLYKKVIKVNYD